jgi:hypothetical protein
MGIICNYLLYKGNNRNDKLNQNKCMIRLLIRLKRFSFHSKRIFLIEYKVITSYITILRNNMLIMKVTLYLHCIALPVIEYKHSFCIIECLLMII